MGNVFGFLFRVLLAVAALIFTASVAVAAVFAFAVWLLRAGWAKLTGKPVSGFHMKFERRFGDMRRWGPPGGGSKRPPGDVTDVEPREPSQPR